MAANGSGSTDWNPALAISEHMPQRIAAAIEERNKLVAKVQELNYEIAVLQTHLQVQSSPTLTRELSSVDQAQELGIARR